MEIARQVIASKPSLSLFQTASDQFFKEFDPMLIFKGPIEFAFLDGMHRCEYLLRDFINTERHCRPSSIIALHDCLPLEVAITSRTMVYNVASIPERNSWWTGDVWRTALLLKRVRPDLTVVSLDAAPTGLVLITNLNPNNKTFSESYPSHVREMMSWDLSEIGIATFFAEMSVESTELLNSEEDIMQRFWL